MMEWSYAEKALARKIIASGLPFVGSMQPQPTTVRHFEMTSTWGCRSHQWIGVQSDGH
jgi:hypothetical protein